MSAKFDIDKIAQLARLKLTDAEKERLGGHLGQIIEYIDQLNKLDTADVEPTSHVLPIHNVFREDKVSRSDADYLASSPSHRDGHYEVPKII
ncbi:MAG: Asp-tRNA(Asn)/Glu-tRNA(Gln) amidotransferase subunit GatC [Nitrospinae bacterium]|nr:Asp-tRNA(Asn)/Glu-tRNA(Gln) amidotransferase subunit GatC [Nitrospinota bacterium]